MRGSRRIDDRQGVLPLSLLLAEAGSPRRVRLADLLRPSEAVRPWVLYFASGSNAAGEIRGFAKIGHPVGVSAPDCRVPCERALLALAGTGVAVFVDNGAIGEKKTGKRIEEAEWGRRLGLATRLARALGSQLHVVAPDKVGDPAETVRRWARWAPQVREIAALGAQVLVPLQSGHGTTLLEMEASARRVLFEGRRIATFVPAIPARGGGATPIGEIRRWLVASRPACVHFLGVGPHTKAGRALLDLVAEVVPGADVRMDSVLLRGHVGRDTKVPRKLTRAIDAVEDELAEHRWGDAPPDVVDADGGRMPDYTEAIFDPDAWLAPKERAVVAQRAGLDADQTRAFVKAPTAFLNTPYHDDADPDDDDPVLQCEMPWLEGALDEAWARYRRKLESHARKERAIARVYGGAR